MLVSLVSLLLTGCLFQSTVPASRADLAAAYLELETALRDNPPPAEQVKPINRMFDEASLAFFSFRYASAMEQIFSIVLDLKKLAGEARSAARLESSLKAEPTPPVGLAGKTKKLVLEIGAFFPIDATELADRNVAIRLCRADTGAVAAEASFTVDVGASSVASAGVELKAATDDGFPIGEYRVTARVGASERTLRRWFSVPRALNDVRDENDAKLSAIKDAPAELKEPIEICKARNALLTDEPSEANSAEFLLDPIAHAGAIAAEIESLQSGKNPYTARPGETWRIVRSDGKNVPVRIYVPEPVAKDTSTPRALVIALHGAGGDEQMFFYGYGAGRIKQLADQHGVIIAAPSSNGFLRGGGVFDALVASLSRDYPIDADRVYVIGHSMGAGGALMLARDRADKIAGVVAIAAGGFGIGGAERVAPTLLVAAENDLIARGYQRAQETADAAAKKGLPVEFRLVRDYGHTLVVGYVLPDAFDWLLARKLGATSRPK